MNIFEFANKVREDKEVSFDRRGWINLDKENECATRVIAGKKYHKVDVGPKNNWSGKFMVDFEGNIYGIKAYGQVHKGHRYGTLETVNNYFWGEYNPIKIK